MTGRQAQKEKRLFLVSAAVLLIGPGSAVAI